MIKTTAKIIAKKDPTEYVASEPPYNWIVGPFSWALHSKTIDWYIIHQAWHKYLEKHKS